MSPLQGKLPLALPLLAVALLFQARLAAASYTTFALESGSATLNGQGVTGNFSAVYQGGGKPTDTYFDDAVIYGNSTFTLQNGGSLGQLNGGDNTTINIQGGSVSSGVFEGGANGFYTLNVSGGNLFSIDLASIPGTTTISGGTVGYFQSYSQSTVNITGGSVGLAGGLNDQISSVFNVSGGKIGNFTALGGTLNFFGSGLAYQNGQVTGFLTDGTPVASAVPINGFIVVGDSHHLTFEAAPVPEASTTVSFGLLLALGAGGLGSPRGARERRCRRPKPSSPGPRPKHDRRGAEHSLASFRVTPPRLSTWHGSCQVAIVSASDMRTTWRRSPR